VPLGPRARSRRDPERPAGRSDARHPRPRRHASFHGGGVPGGGGRGRARGSSRLLIPRISTDSSFLRIVRRRHHPCPTRQPSTSNPSSRAS
jgi:hypothetical protein